MPQFLLSLERSGLAIIAAFIKVNADLTPFIALETLFKIPIVALNARKPDATETIIPPRILESSRMLFHKSSSFLNQRNYLIHRLDYRCTGRVNPTF